MIKIILPVLSRLFLVFSLAVSNSRMRFVCASVQNEHIYVKLKFLIKYGILKHLTGKLSYVIGLKL